MFQLYLLTFNCARTLVDPQNLAPSLFNALPKDAPLPDIVAFSLQEVAPIAYSFLGGSYLKPYFDRLTTTIQLAGDLHNHGGEQYTHVASRSLGMTALMIFARPRFMDRIQWIRTAGVGVGFSNMGNKGAVAMRLGIACPGSDKTLDLTFTAAHLAPMESNVEPRNKNWENIVRNLVFSNDDDSAYSSREEIPLLGGAAELLTDQNGLFTSGNHVWFFGDLNYRTGDRAPGEDAYKSYPQPTSQESSPLHFSQLLQNDQLSRERHANRTLHGFQEMPIKFPPTYKYSMVHQSKNDVEEEQWIWSKHRYPSWCDRILYLPSHPSSKVEPQNYTALPIQYTSDHRPVALSVRVDDKPVVHDSHDIRCQPPFPINPHWRERRDAARRWEVIVGVLSYLSLTVKGNAILITVLGSIFGSWWLLGQTKR